MEQSIRVKFIGCAAALDALKECRKARIQVSMFNRFSNGMYLNTLISELANFEISELEIQVSDTLQRHNLQWHGYTPEKAYAHSKKIGMKWARSNCDAFVRSYQYFNRFEINKWDYWINHKDFLSDYNIILNIFNSDAVFREMVFKTIDDYMISIKENPTIKNVILSKEFVLEEIAVSNLSARIDPALEIYAGPRFEPEEYLARFYKGKVSLSHSRFISASFE